MASLNCLWRNIERWNSWFKRKQNIKIWKVSSWLCEIFRAWLGEKKKGGAKQLFDKEITADRNQVLFVKKMGEWPWRHYGDLWWHAHCRPQGTRALRAEWLREVLRGPVRPQSSFSRAVSSLLPVFQGSAPWPFQLWLKQAQVQLGLTLWRAQAVKFGCVHVTLTIWSAGAVEA